MQLTHSFQALASKPLFAAATSKSPLKLGDIPVSADGIPNHTVAEAIQKAQRSSFFREYKDCVPASVSLRVFQEGKNAAQIEIQGLPALGENRYQVIYGPANSDTVARGLEDVLCGFRQMRREGQL